MLSNGIWHAHIPKKVQLWGFWGIFGPILARKRVKNQFGAKQKNIPLEIPLRILKNQKNWNEVRLGTLEPGMIVARRRRRRRHHDDNTLLRGVKRAKGRVKINRVPGPGLFFEKRTGAQTFFRKKLGGGDFFRKKLRGRRLFYYKISLFKKIHFWRSKSNIFWVKWLECVNWRMIHTTNTLSRFHDLR